MARATTYTGAWKSARAAEMVAGAGGPDPEHAVTDTPNGTMPWDAHHGVGTVPSQLVEAEDHDAPTVPGPTGDRTPLDHAMGMDSHGVDAGAVDMITTGIAPVVDGTITDARYQVPMDGTKTSPARNVILTQTSNPATSPNQHQGWWITQTWDRRMRRRSIGVLQTPVRNLAAATNATPTSTRRVRTIDPVMRRQPGNWDQSVTQDQGSGNAGYPPVAGPGANPFGLTQWGL